MQRTTHKFLALLTFTLLMVFGAAQPGYAIPTMQLDILGGVWVSSDPIGDGADTIVTDDNIFSLFAYLDDASSLVTRTFVQDNGDGTQEEVYGVAADTEFRISVSLIPRTDIGCPAETPDCNGSFSINGTSYDVTGDMQFGTPPLEDAVAAFCTTSPTDPKCNLPPHAVFPTFFLEQTFSFEALNGSFSSNFLTQGAGDKVATTNLTLGSTGVASADYDTQLAAGSGPLDGSGVVLPKNNPYMFFNEFAIDVTNLSSAVGLHFDFYAVKSSTGEALDFNPFSHDAASGGGGTIIPEPSSLLLLGSGLLALLGRRYRRRSSAGTPLA